jgi:GNAT superfamily N-acetyltransferase
MESISIRFRQEWLQLKSVSVFYQMSSKKQEQLNRYDMMDSIIFKSLDKKYYNDIKKMICDTWRFDKYVPEKYLETFVKTVFYSYMCECNYSQIALGNNKVAGIMLASVTTDYFDLKYFFLMIFNAFKLSIHLEGRKCFKILKSISACEKEIQKAVKVSNKLLLLIVDQNMRNCGIGSALINVLEQKCKSYHLITDTLCNHVFYDMKGFQKVNSKQFVYFSGLEKMYLYQR